MNETLFLDGRRVSWTQVDGGPGQPLLLVHGHTGAKDDFAGVMDALAVDRPVIAVDLPGHGDSQGPDDERWYTLQNQADWLAQLIDALGLPQLHLLGHSMGGLIAQRFAVAQPNRLRSLILMGTGLAALRPEAMEFIERVAAVARAEGVQAAFEESVRSWADAPVDEAMKARRQADRDYLERRYRKLNVAAIIGGARELGQAEPVAQHLQLAAPVLVIHGDQDYAWQPPEQQALAEAIPGAERAAIAFSYHSPQKENPEGWLAEIQPFLRRADSKPIDVAQ